MNAEHAPTGASWRGGATERQFLRREGHGFASNDADVGLLPDELDPDSDIECHFEIFRADERPMTSTLFSGGDWRWRMWMDHNDKTHPIFWQQLFRHLVTDTPGQVIGTTPKTVLSDDTRVPIRMEVRDKQFKPVVNAKVQARFLSPDGTTATMELAPQALEEGVYSGEWTAEKPGSYVAVDRRTSRWGTEPDPVT